MKAVIYRNAGLRGPSFSRMQVQDGYREPGARITVYDDTNGQHASILLNPEQVRDLFDRITPLAAASYSGRLIVEGLV